MLISSMSSKSLATSLISCVFSSRLLSLLEVR
jgi:hypothetical protein